MPSPCGERDVAEKKLTMRFNAPGNPACLWENRAGAATITPRSPNRRVPSTEKPFTGAIHFFCIPFCEALP